MAKGRVPQVSDMSEPVGKLRVEAGGLLPRAARLTDFVPPQRFIVPEHLKGVML